MYFPDRLNQATKELSATEHWIYFSGNGYHKFWLACSCDKCYITYEISFGNARNSFYMKQVILLSEYLGWQREEILQSILYIINPKLQQWSKQTSSQSVRSLIDTSETWAWDRDLKDNHNHTWWSDLGFEGKGESDTTLHYSSVKVKVQSCWWNVERLGLKMLSVDADPGLRRALDIFKACNF